MFVPFDNGVALAFTQESLGNQIVADMATQRLHAENGEALWLRWRVAFVCLDAGALGVQREKDKAHQRLMERRKVGTLAVSLTSRNRHHRCNQNLQNRNNKRVKGHETQPDAAAEASHTEAEDTCPAPPHDVHAQSEKQPAASPSALKRKEVAEQHGVLRSVLVRV